MNYYERIQKSIDYIESRLDEEIRIEQAAREAYMSCSSYYRMFFALTGYPVKDYIRRRRISNAVMNIKTTGGKILPLALKYGFESNEAFTRAFRRITGHPPSAFRSNRLHYHFGRMDILEKYHDVQDGEFLEKYPDIKVLKELKPFRVAYHCYYGRDPEDGAFAVIQDWLKQSGLNLEQDGLRIFGFNNPSPSSPDQAEYGYEVWVTIGDNVKVNDGRIGTKTFPGGLYAVCGVRNLVAGGEGAEIVQAWQRLNMWLRESKYTLADHQWLEEHLEFSDDFEHVGGLDLYMPITLRANISGGDKELVFVEPLDTVTTLFTGKDAYGKAIAFMYEFFGKHGGDVQGDRRRAFCHYNQERAGHEDFRCKVYVTVGKGCEPKEEGLSPEVFPGGLYACEEVNWGENAPSWYKFIDWIKASEEYCFDDRPFMEEFVIDERGLEPGTRIRHFMPVRRKQG